MLVAVAALIGVLVGAGSAVALSNDETGGKFYKATSTLFFEPPSDTSTGSDIYNTVDQVAFLTVSGDVPDDAATALGEDDRIVEHVLVTSNATLSTIEITGAATNANEAESIADTFADTLVADVQAKDQAFFDEQRDEILARSDDLAAQIDTLDQQLAGGVNPVVEAQRDALVNQYRLTQEELQTLAVQGTPQKRLSTLEKSEAVPIDESEYDERLSRGQLGENIVTQVPGGSSTTAEEPTGADESRLDSPLDRGILGGVLGLVVGIGLALLGDHLDQRIRTREDAEEEFGWPVLAEVPPLTRSQQKRTEVMSLSSPLSRAAEAYRTVRTSLLFQRAVTEAAASENGGGDGQNGRRRSKKQAEGAEEADSRALVVMVASPGPGEGKTTTSANLAAIFAESGSSVLVVNCDFRRPQIHKYLGVDDQPRRIIETDIPRVRLVSNVLSNVAANPTAVVEEQVRTVDVARNSFDIIILDTAALLATSDALELLPAADTVVVVARDGVTSRAAAVRTRELLTRLNARVTGLVFVGAEATPDSPYYYYSRETSRDVSRLTEAEAAEEVALDRAEVEVVDARESGREAVPDAEAAGETTEVHASADGDLDREVVVETEPTPPSTPKVD